MTDDQWSDLPADTKEFKLNVSEWLLNSTSANYLLNDRDYDSHVPLLLTVHATIYTPGRARQMNCNPETLQEKAERRKQRQKENKARSSSGAVASSTDPSSPPREAGSGASSGATASGSQRLAEPADPPGGKSAGKGSKGGKSSKGKDKGGKSSWGPWKTLTTEVTPPVRPPPRPDPWARLQPVVFFTGTPASTIRHGRTRDSNWDHDAAVIE